MRLIIKRADGSTNLLLFIYKLHRRLTAGAKNEIRLSVLLDLMKALGKDETAVRMSLSRAVRSGLFENRRKGREVYYSPTLPGQEVIDASVKKSDCILSRYEQRNSDWDAKWLCVNFLRAEGPDGEKLQRAAEGLKILGFWPVNGRVWLSPYDMRGELGKLMDEYGCGGGIIATYGEMASNMGFDPFLEKVFKLKKYANPYKRFIASYADTLAEIRKSCGAGEILPEGVSIPLFHELERIFFNISFQDPFLPKKLLPEWEGDRAAAMASELFELLAPSLRYCFGLNGA